MDSAPDAEPTRPLSTTDAASAGSSAPPSLGKNAAPDEPAAAHASPRRGTQIGRYIVIDTLGAGGMGEVLSAYDPELDRRVALKLLRVTDRSSPQRARARARLLLEAQALAKLSHPNVVSVYDAGTHGRRVFIAMEHIDGVTLGDWLTTPRSWREIVDVMLKAGQGLAAAHAVGLVHRDFKPANVMIGTDGRVRVLDFGLARRLDDTGHPDEPLDALASGDALEASGESRHHGSSLTETGIVMGTPAYMAPEQFFGGTIDARSDQFAFCVVLFRALYGVAPFGGRSFEEIGRAVERGKIAEVSSGSGVPRRIRVALERGLSATTSDRFDTMTALLEELRIAIGGGRRRRVAIAAFAIAIAGGSSLVWIAGAKDRPCSDLHESLAGAWDDGRREAVEHALLATHAAFAEHAGREVVRTIDAYAAGWLQMRTQACEATRVRGDQSEALMDLRIACLDARRRDLVALVDVLAAADVKVAEKAIDAAQRLPSIEACADTEGLLAAVAPPSDPEIAAAVASARDRLATARAMQNAGKYEDALSITKVVDARAAEIGYRPLSSEAAVALGSAFERTGAPDDAIASLERGLWAAIALGDHRTQVEALLGLSNVASASHSDGPGAQRHLAHARAVVERMGEPPELLAHVLVGIGTAHLRTRAIAAAEAAYREAIEICGDDPTLRRTKLAALSNLAAARGTGGNYREALEAIAEGLTLAEQYLGPAHPDVAVFHNNLGATYSRIGDGKRAIEAHERALAIDLAALGPEHPEIARIELNLGVAYSSIGDDESALSKYLESLRIRTQALGPDSPAVALTSNNVGDALIRLGRHDEAVPYIEEALRILTQDGAEHPDAAYALTSLAEARLALDEVARAREAIRGAMRIAAQSTSEPFKNAQMNFVAARVLWAAGERTEALALAQTARTDYASPQRDATPEVAKIDAWLAARR